MSLSSQRRLGFALGLIFGLGFSIVSNSINRWVMPEIPLFVPSPGTVGLILLTTAFFGLLGLLAAWTEETLPGVLISGLAGSVISSIWMVVTETTNRAGTFALLALVFLPRVFFYVPFGALIRWLIEKLVYRPYQNIAPARRLLPVVYSLIVISLLGLYSLQPEETRLSLERMEAIMAQGFQASTREELPKPLQKVEGFLSNAEGEYAYQIGSNPDVLPVQRPVVEYGEPEPFLIIRFENGFRFGCVFSPPYVVPACIDF